MVHVFVIGASLAYLCCTHECESVLHTPYTDYIMPQGSNKTAAACPLQELTGLPGECELDPN